MKRKDAIHELARRRFKSMGRIEVEAFVVGVLIERFNNKHLYSSDFLEDLFLYDYGDKIKIED